MVGFGPNQIVKIFERATRPEHLFEIARFCFDPTNTTHLVEDDRPTPNGGPDKENEDQLDDDVCVQNETEDGEVSGDRPCDCSRFNCLLFHDAPWLRRGLRLSDLSEGSVNPGR